MGRSRCAWRSATCARRASTRAAHGGSCSSIRPRSRARADGPRPATSSILSIVSFSFANAAGILLAPSRAGRNRTVALMLVIGPASARADWLFTPNIGIGFGGDTPSNDKLTYGASLGWMGAGIAGFEADWSYTP